MSRIGSQQYTVSGTPVAIAVGNATSNGNSPTSVWISNSSATAIFLGGPNVSSANGYSFTKQNEPLLINVHSGDTLYAVTAGGAATLSVLQT